MMKNKVFNFCKREMSNNPELYLDSSNCINYTLLAETFIDEKNVDYENEEDIYEYVIDFFEIRLDLNKKYNC